MVDCIHDNVSPDREWKLVGLTLLVLSICCEKCSYPIPYRLMPSPVIETTSYYKLQERMTNWFRLIFLGIYDENNHVKVCWPFISTSMRKSSNQTITENYNQPKCKIMEPDPNGYFYKTLLYLRFTEHWRRGIRNIVRVGRSGSFGTRLYLPVKSKL